MKFVRAVLLPDTLSRIDSGQIEPDIQFTHPAIYVSDEVYAKQRHIRNNVGGVIRTLKAKLASPARSWLACSRPSFSRRRVSCVPGSAKQPHGAERDGGVLDQLDYGVRDGHLFAVEA
jgi:hypothetical protein